MKRNHRSHRLARPSRAQPHPNSQLSIQNSEFTIQHSLRVGLGNDLHRLTPGRRLILGGVRIQFDKGPVGHSDGDVLSHAICDALLGAATLGDIGRHFPNTSPKWHNASSLLFLRHVRKLLEEAGFAIVNVDATIGLERPKLAPYISRIEQKIAATLGVKSGQISVKAKSGEGLDAVGRGEAIRADAIALISNQKSNLALHPRT